jgi:hypothetical protein
METCHDSRSSGRDSNREHPKEKPKALLFAETCSAPCLSICLWLHNPCGPRPLFQFLNLYTAGRTPWTGDEPVSRLRPTHRTSTQNERTDICASTGIRTHEPSVRNGKDGSCLRQRGHCDRPAPFFQFYKCKCFVWNMSVRLGVHSRGELQNSGSDI